MAAREKKTDEAAPVEKPKTTEEASGELVEKLAEAAKDDPKPEEKKREPVKKLALSEVEGEIADGAKVRIGVAKFLAPGHESGEYQNAPFIVPAKWEVVGAEAAPQWVHARDVAHPEKTLCRLSTNWVSGIVHYSDGTLLTCEPCARRLIAVKKLDPKVHEKLKADAVKARDERISAEKAKKEAKKDARKGVVISAPLPPEAEEPKTEAKPDPKPATPKAKKPEAA